MKGLSSEVSLAVGVAGNTLHKAIRAGQLHEFKRILKLGVRKAVYGFGRLLSFVNQASPVTKATLVS